MTPRVNSGPTSRELSSRVLGGHVGKLPGPTVIVCSAIHGNEPAGVHAARRVHDVVTKANLPIRGEWIAIIGNRAALKQGCRFVDEDLNRCWTHDRVRALLAADPANDRAEQTEQRAILSVIGEAAQRARGPVIVIDLHTTSSKSPPFLVFSDTLANRGIATQLPGTMILGLEEAVDGTLLDYICEIGHRAVVIESGQHEDPAAVALHESYIWLALVAAGSLSADEVPDYARHRGTLQTAARGSPRCVDVRYRHFVQPDDHFQMDPGHETFAPVQRNAPLAKDKNGAVRAPCSGLMLMPLYQPQGSDGFFIVGVVRPIWLALSRLLRTLRLHILLPLLPGVRREVGSTGSLRVNSRVARWLTLEIFHLFGYRNRGAIGDSVLFERRG